MNPRDGDGLHVDRFTPERHHPREERRTMARTAPANVTDGYVDIYLLPISERNVEAYRRQATSYGKVAPRVRRAELPRVSRRRSQGRHEGR
jgi:hypothetical protein